MLIRYQTVPSLINDVFSTLDSFDRAFPRNQNSCLRDDYPYMNVAEYKDQIEVVMELPGVDKVSIKIQVHDGVLSVSGERKAPELPKGSEWIRREISYGTFTRSLQIPERIDVSKVAAEHINGILRIVLPKLEEAKPHEIRIR